MEPDPDIRPERRRPRQLSGVQIMFAAVLAVGLALAINLSSLVASSRPLQELYQQVSAEIRVLEREQAQLYAERDFARSDAFVEMWARSEGKMVRPGEVLVIPVPTGEILVEATPEAAPPVMIETTPPEPEPWMLWWALFFDSPPPRF